MVNAGSRVTARLGGGVQIGAHFLLTLDARFFFARGGGSTHAPIPHDRNLQLGIAWCLMRTENLALKFKLMYRVFFMHFACSFVMHNKTYMYNRKSVLV